MKFLLLLIILLCSASLNDAQVNDSDLRNLPQVGDDPVELHQELIKTAAADKSLGFKFQVHPMVRQYLYYYTGRGRQTMEAGLHSSGTFNRMARQIFRKEGIPENIVWLGQVMSGWKPVPAFYGGLWGMDNRIAARYNLRRNKYIDEKYSFEKATWAAAVYLKFLAKRYNGNWELALAAYTSGEANVDRAIRRAGVADFWIAYPYLPKETRNYVANVLATILIANYPQHFGFGHIRPAQPLDYDQIRVSAFTSLELLARASDTSIANLRYLNPELRSNVSPPESYIIRVPAGTAKKVLDVLRAIPQKGKAVPPVAPITGIVRVVKAKNGDTVARLAARLGVSAVEIAKFNGLLPDSQLSAGREIRIPARLAIPDKP